MQQYYYLVATLPQLFYGSSPPFSNYEFFEKCMYGVSSSDLHIIENAKLYEIDEIECRDPVIIMWKQWEAGLRNELARLRASKKGIDPAPYIRYIKEFPETLHIAQEAFNQELPNRAEEILDRARWNFFEEVSVAHFFDVITLAVYYLKLQLLEKKKKQTKERGKERYQKTYSEILTKIAEKSGFRDIFQV